MPTPLVQRFPPVYIAITGAHPRFSRAEIDRKCRCLRIFPQRVPNERTAAVYASRFDTDKALRAERMGIPVRSMAELDALIAERRRHHD